MIEVIAGPLVCQPQSWCIVFDRSASTWWASALAMGRYKHVRAFGYVPFLHVWLFFDPHLGAVDLTVAADGEPAQRLIAGWLADADMIRMEVRAQPRRHFPFAGWCVPTIKRLIGLRSGALRPDALWRDCLANGGRPFEAIDATSPAVSAARA